MDSFLAAPAPQAAAVPEGATHYQPHQKTYYKRVSATEWFLWSDRQGWLPSKGTSDSSDWVMLNPVPAATQAQATQSPAEGDALREMEARKDAAYEERNRCVALIARMAVAIGLPVAVTKTAIEGWSEDWHGCIYISLPTGQASWHFHDSHAHLFAGLPATDATWDGHDTPEKYRRVETAFANVQPKSTAQKSVTITAVGEIKWTEENGPDVSWLLEGGAYELPHGTILLVAESTLTDEDGFGEVYTQAPELDHEQSTDT